MEKNLNITNPPFNEQIWPVPSDFVKSRFHCNLKKIDEDLFNEYSSKAFKAGITVKKKFQESVDSSASPEKRILLDESVSCSLNSITSPLTSTPAKTVRSVTTVPVSPVRLVI